MHPPRLVERVRYTPSLPVEEFMVHLLKEHIEREISAVRGGSKALDVGCGGQPFRATIEARGFSYVSADAQDPLGVVDHVFEIDGAFPESLALAGPFDLILCTEVLEHVADWSNAFRNLASVLAPDGALVVTCPVVYVLHAEP